MQIKFLLSLLLISVLLAQAQVKNPSKWTSTNEGKYGQALVSSASFLYDYVILDYDLTVQARAGAIDGDGEDIMIYFTAFDQEGEVVSQREYDWVEGDIRVCKTNVENEYFYIYGSEELYVGFIDALTGDVTRGDQIDVSKGYSTTFSYAACSYAKDRMYIIATYGTNEWNTAVLTIDLGQSKEYTIGDLQILSSGVSQTQAYTIQGYNDGSALAFAQSSSVNEKFQRYHFKTNGQLDETKTKQITNGFFNDISSGNVKLNSVKDLKSEMSTMLYGNSEALQIYTFTPSGKEICYNKLDNKTIKQYYDIQYGYLDDSTIFVINTVSDERIVFLIDPKDCSLKYEQYYVTTLNYGSLYPIISGDSKIKLWVYGSNSLADNSKIKAVNIGSVQVQGCEEFQLFECLSCDESSDMEYEMSDYGLCVSPFEEEDDEDSDGKNGGKKGSNGAGIVQSSLLAVLVAFVACLV